METANSGSSKGPDALGLALYLDLKAKGCLVFLGRPPKEWEEQRKRDAEDLERLRRAEARRNRGCQEMKERALAALKRKREKSHE